MKPLERAILVFSAIVLAGATAAHVIGSSRFDERRLVLDCMAELGWETASEDATMSTQLEQSRTWCEGFVRGAP